MSQKRARKSSRLRMANRMKHRGKKQHPASALVDDVRRGYIVGQKKVPNRAQKRFDKAWKRQRKGRAVKEAEQLKRRFRLQKLRRVTNTIRRQARRVLRLHLQGA